MGTQLWFPKLKLPTNLFCLFAENGPEIHIRKRAWHRGVAHPVTLEAWWWNSKGVALTRLGRMEDALACFIRALELDPRFALARFNRGAAEDVLGRPEEAVGSFEAFLSLATPSQRAQIQHAQKRLLVLKAPRN